MQTVSAAFTNATQAQIRRVTTKITIAWQAGVWTDESVHLRSHTGTLRIAAPGDELIAPGDVGTATAVLHNPTVTGAGRRFSWKNTAGPLAADIGGPFGLFGKAVRISVGFYVLPDLTIELVTIFTGVIYDWQEDPQAHTLTLYLRDIGFKYLQDKISTLVQRDLRADAALTYLADQVSIPESLRVFDVASARIPFTWLDDESVLTEMWEIARSVGGRCFFDQLGRLHFETAAHWARQTDITWTFSPTNFKTLRPTSNPDSLASTIVVEWAGRYIGLADEVYTLSETKWVAPGATISFEARFGNPLYAYAALDATDYKVISAGAVDLTSFVTITVPEATRYAQRCTVTITNRHTTLAATLIYLRIRGYSLQGGPTEQATVDVTQFSMPFPRTRSVRGNMYVQTAVQAEALARILSASSGRLIPQWQFSGVPGVPQLELGDRVQFSAPDVMNTNRGGFVTEIAWSWAGDARSSFTQQITILDAEGLFAFSDYYVIGTTPLGEVGRAWH